MSTTGGGGLPPGDEYPTAQYPRPGRRPTRRISERLAEAAAEPPPGRVKGMPNASPWQRSHAIWHRAGVDWTRVEPGRRPPRPVAGHTDGYALPALDKTPYPEPEAPHTEQPRPVVRALPGAPIGAPQNPPAPPPPPHGEATLEESEPWAPVKTRRSLPTKPLAIGLAAVVIVAAGAYGVIVLGGDKDTPKKKAAQPVAISADALFTSDPASKTSGRAHGLSAVAASGGTLVAVGSEQGGSYSRAQFLSSGDGGRSWQVGRIRTADGGDPPQGEYPRLLAGSAGAWTALGLTRTGMIAWTSTDARTWTRQPATAYAPDDQVASLARTSSGFVATGASHGKAVVWVSGDGRTWQRLDADSLKPPAGGSIPRLGRVAAHGDAVVAQGVLQTTETYKDKKKKKKTRTVQNEAFWRSADGGHTWAPVTVPQAQGSGGNAVGLTADANGFYAVREGSRTTGSKKHKKTSHFGVVLGSADGQKWTPVGQYAPGGYASTSMFAGADGALAAVVSANGKNTMISSADGKTWKAVGDVPGGRALTGLAISPGGVVVTARRDDTGQAFVTVAGAGDVNMATIPDAVHTEREIDRVFAAGGQIVAVGSANSDPGVWTSADGRTWTRAKIPPLIAPGLQRVLSITHGTKGWLAVGRTGNHPLTLMSADGVTWDGAPTGKAFDNSDMVLSGVAAGPAGYVMAGQQDGRTAVTWFSTDLKTWSRTAADGARDVPKGINDVAPVGNGFVAAGYQTVKGKGAVPAVWTSPDGRKWQLVPNVPGTGALNRIAVHNGVIVAGGDTASLVSVDQGKTWQQVSLPPGAAVTAATGTSRGFVLLATLGTDVVVLTSPDGRTWKTTKPHGNGLDGTGIQRMNGVTTVGQDLLAVGYTADYRRDGTTLWRTPIP